MTAYDLDTFAWANEQADALRRRSANEIDWDNVAEEIESLGKTQVGELSSRYIVLLSHLLKWIYQPERRGRSWQGTIAEQRLRIAKHLRENPSLKSVEANEFADAFAVARVRAAAETDLELTTFPEEPPFTVEQAKDDDFWREAEEPGTRLD